MAYPMKLQKVMHSNYRVVIEPDLNNWFFGERTDEAEYRRHSGQCNEIAKAVMRHVDGVASATFECDTKVVCKFCECDPEPLTELTGEEGEMLGMPNCCADAQRAWKEWMAEEKAPAITGNHWSDCALHNEPAMPAGPCDCGANAPKEPAA